MKNKLKTFKFHMIFMLVFASSLIALPEAWQKRIMAAEELGVSLAYPSMIDGLYITPDISTFTFLFSETVDASSGKVELSIYDDYSTAGYTLAVLSGQGTRNVTFSLPAGVPLEPGAAYTLTLSGFKDEAGNYVMTNPKQFNFKTTVKPTVKIDGFSPSSYTTGIPIGQSLFIEFTRAISKGFGYINIFNADDTLFEQISVASGNVVVTGNKVEIRHKIFKPNSTYYVLIDPNAFYEYDYTTQYYDGIRWRDDWTFRTENIDLSLPVSSFSPKNQEQNVPIGTLLEIQFDREVKINEGKIKIYEDNSYLFQTIDARDLILADSGYRVSIPHNNFEYNKLYTVEIDDGLFIGKDGILEFKGIVNYNVWSFSTESINIQINGKTLDTSNIEVSWPNPVYTLNIAENNNYGEIILPVNFKTLFPDLPQIGFEITDGSISFTLDESFEKLIGLNDIMSSYKLRRSEIGYRITIEPYNASAMYQNITKKFQNLQIIGHTPKVTIEVIRLSTKRTIIEINEFTEKFTRTVNTSRLSTISPNDYYAVFLYDNSSDLFSFVPHRKYTQLSTAYITIDSNVNGVYIIVNNETNYSDISGVWAWSEPFVKLASAKGILVGIGGNIYSPQSLVTRAQLAQMISEAMSLPSASPDTKEYSDVKKAQWFYDAIMRLRSAGFLERFDDSEFKPDQPITREEMANILAQAIKYSSQQVFFENVPLSGLYNDIGQMNPLFISDIRLVVSLNIMNGMSPTTFGPTENVNRGQAATVLIQMLKALYMID